MTIKKLISNLFSSHEKTVQELTKSNPFTLFPLSYDEQKRVIEARVMTNFSESEVRKQTSNHRLSKSFTPKGWKTFSSKDSKGNIHYPPMQRGHLLAHSLSGVNEQMGEDYFFPITQWANCGVNKAHKSNPLRFDNMLHYEKRIKDWLQQNPDSSIDYKVRLHYSSDYAQYPYEICIKTKAFKTADAFKPINFNLIANESKAKLQNISQITDEDGYSSVTIPNADPNFTFDYETGELVWKENKA